MIPIQRAQMKVRIFIPGKEAKKIKEKIVPMLNVESESFNPDLELVSFAYGFYEHDIKVLCDVVAQAEVF